MLSQIKNIKKLIAASLFLVMMLPCLFSILHHFKSHNHIDCNEVKSHLHELTNECNTCDFNLLSFDFKLANTFETNKNQILKTKRTDFKSVFINLFNPSNKQLRAPPYMS
jgi:hypothetical protein